MLYYRRKVLLSLLEAFGGELGKIELQKILFLLCKPQASPSYEFLPYQYGCFSFQANWDLKTLEKYGVVSEFEQKWVLNKHENYLSLIEASDKSRLLSLVRAYKSFSADDLMRLTYIRYPYYAINSKKAKYLLSTEEYQIIEKEKPVNNETILYSIGYEGITLEKYFNKLITNDVKVLCDVRRNPLSQKVGFSKSTLQKVCDSLSIVYVHIPDLGVESDKRQNLKTQGDYDVLFADYEKNHLIHQNESIEKIFELLIKHNRVALTCFEASFCQCHRSKVAKAITLLPNWNYKLKHL